MLRGVIIIPRMSGLFPREQSSLYWEDSFISSLDYFYEYITISPQSHFFVRIASKIDGMPYRQSERKGVHRSLFYALTYPL